MNTQPSNNGLLGMVVYLLFLLDTVVVGPLEAILGLGLYCSEVSAVRVLECSWKSGRFRRYSY